MLDVNIIVPSMLAICGVSLFLVWPLKMRWVIRKYAPELYRSRPFYCQCFLSALPLLEWALCLVWTQPRIRAGIVGVITICFVPYLLLAIRDTQIVQKIILKQNVSVKELRSMVTICYMMRYFFIFIAVSNIFWGMDLLSWTPSLGSSVRSWTGTILIGFAWVLSTAITLIETQLMKRRKKRLELACPRSSDAQQME